MVNYKVVFTKQAEKEAKNLLAAGLRPKVETLIELLKKDPFTPYPPYEKLIGQLNGLYSRRINIQHRLVYEVFPEDRIVKILRMWTHYE